MFPTLEDSNVAGDGSRSMGLLAAGPGGMDSGVNWGEPGIELWSWVDEGGKVHAARGLPGKGHAMRICNPNEEDVWSLPNMSSS